MDKNGKYSGCMEQNEAIKYKIGAVKEIILF